jgi:hypothetical protein
MHPLALARSLTYLLSCSPEFPAAQWLKGRFAAKEEALARFYTGDRRFAGPLSALPISKVHARACAQTWRLHSAAAEPAACGF